MPRNANPDKTVGFAWVGRWGNGDIGHLMPDFLAGHASKILAPNLNPPVPSDKHLVKCRITIEVIKDSLGRPIVRKASTIDGVRRASVGKTLRAMMP